VVCEELGKFPHEVEDNMTIAEITEYSAFLSLRQKERAKNAAANGRKGKQPTKPRHAR
tara:strand:+ start:38847 stop:39020 length:174 start_codon:yes stop_codon:yes gene_type:complete